MLMSSEFRNPSLQRFKRICQKLDLLRRSANSKSNVEDLEKTVVGDIFNPDHNKNWLHGPYPKGSNHRQSQAYKSLRPITDPSETTVILFPGQGTQYVGMGKSLMKFPNVKEIYEAASGILGYDLLSLCETGPSPKLDRTEFCQPAIFVHSLACVEKLKVLDPSAIENCITTAGFSVGEITALTFAGAFSFEDAVKLVQLRASAMQRASQAIPSSMMTVFYKPGAKVGLACEIAKKWCIKEKKIREVECCVANYLFPGCKVIAGNEEVGICAQAQFNLQNLFSFLEALRFLEENKEDFLFKKCKRLPVSGAFHTSLMKSAADSFKELLETVDINEPLIPVHSNVNNAVYKSAGDILRLLPRQMYSPVKWEQLMHIIYERNPGQSFPKTFECGPGSTLLSVLRAVNSKASLSMKSVDI